MHPIITHYHDPGTGKIKRESHVFFSDDITHDHHSVNHFLELSLSILQGICKISKVIIFSDGRSVQYKSRGPLADLGLQKLPTEHSYFGSEHGKSECVGETGVVSHAVERAIVGRQVIINDANDKVKLCRANLSRQTDEETGDGFTRRFFLVDEINHYRQETNVCTVKGVRKLHQVQNTGTNYEIKCRDLSWYCARCINCGQCNNNEYISSFRHVKITVVGTQAST